ncbi:MAG: peptidoglycan DD-metalloendopeptidase family protein [Micromonosporaceae bacterium]|nr:peptidoglycan DD-metalloendopeptidase family protein [Micromonosporaceae bacterium]
MTAAALLLAVGVLPPPAAARADPDPRADRERIDAEVAETAAILEHATERAQAAAERFAAADAALPAAEARVDEARGVVLAAQAQATTAQREADEAEVELATAGVRFDDSVAQVEQARDAVAAFAVAAFKGTRLTGVNLLLRARGPAEAVERLGYLDHVAGVERQRVDELATARLYARQAENEATLAYERAESARRATAAALARAEAAEAAAETAATDAAGLVEQRAEALAVAETERGESLRRYERVEAEAARIEAELREWEANQPAPAPAPPAAPGPPASGTGFLLPTEGWQSSGFGMRFDPFFGVWQLHAGVDIAAPGGAPIYAVAGGTVIRAGWNGGYGNFTCLGHGTHHGQGLASCYAHQSQILVGQGQSVRRGEVIGRVGTTGASTGNHLHFEVRLDGSPTDPIPFLPGF